MASPLATAAAAAPLYFRRLYWCKYISYALMAELWNAASLSDTALLGVVKRGTPGLVFYESKSPSLADNFARRLEADAEEYRRQRPRLLHKVDAARDRRWRDFRQAMGTATNLRDFICEMGVRHVEKEFLWEAWENAFEQEDGNMPSPAEILKYRRKQEQLRRTLAFARPSLAKERMGSEGDYRMDDMELEGGSNGDINSWEPTTAPQSKAAEERGKVATNSTSTTRRLSLKPMTPMESRHTQMNMLGTSRRIALRPLRPTVEASGDGQLTDDAMGGIMQRVVERRRAVIENNAGGIERRMKAAQRLDKDKAKSWSVGKTSRATTNADLSKLSPEKIAALRLEAASKKPLWIEEIRPPKRDDNHQAREKLLDILQDVLPPKKR